MIESGVKKKRVRILNNKESSLFCFTYIGMLLEVIPPISAEIGSFEGVIMLGYGLVLCTKKFLELLIVGFEGIILIRQLMLRSGMP